MTRRLAEWQLALPLGLAEFEAMVRAELADNERLIRTLQALRTKGNTLLQWVGIDNRLIDMAAERNPDKFGARTLGTDIPIVSEEESRALNPDYYLVLPWHFLSRMKSVNC